MAKYRPCVVRGQNALFHCYKETENPIIHLGFDIKTEAREALAQRIMDDYQSKHILPASAVLRKIKVTMAIVEFQDGHIEEVAPTELCFLDSNGQFLKYTSFFKAVEENQKR